MNEDDELPPLEALPPEEDAGMDVEPDDDDVDDDDDDDDAPDDDDDDDDDDDEASPAVMHNPPEHVWRFSSSAQSESDLQR